MSNTLSPQIWFWNAALMWSTWKYIYPYQFIFCKWAWYECDTIMPIFNLLYIYMCVCVRVCIRWCRSPYQQRIPLLKEAWIWDAMTLIWRHCNAISKCTTNFWAKLSFQCQSDDKKLHQPSKLAFSERPVCFTCALSIVFEHKINFCADIVRVVCFSCVWLSCICLSLRSSLRQK